MKPRPPTKRRKFPRNYLAMCGYWSTPVQHVIKNWRGRIGEDVCKKYIVSCWFAFAHPELYRKCCDISQVTIENVEHEQYVFDLLSAYRELFRSNDKPAIWLLRWAGRGDGYDENGNPVPYSYKELRQFIREFSGPDFSESVFAQTTKRLRLYDRIGR
jgi:hypothetical protein